MSLSESHEIERKYSVPERASVPDLADIAGVSRVRRRRPVTMQAQYFDTESLALIAAKITLRKRVGGADEGWHLKLPGDGFRRELHEPLTDDNHVPDSFLELLHTVLRGTKLRPVVKLTTRRTIHELLDDDESVLAEISDDRVTSNPDLDGLDELTWREWEVELKGGGIAVLDLVEPRLLDRGATDDAGPSKLARALADRAPAARPAPPKVGKKATVADIAHAYLWGEIEHLKEHDPGARVSAPDAIHQMRVAARRLRSVLSSYRDIVGREGSDAMRAELKALADALGGARDSEVMLARLNALLDDQPADKLRGPIRERIDEAMRQRYDSAHAQALEFMTSPRYYALLDELDHLVDDWSPQAGDEPAKKASDAFGRDWKRLRNAVHDAETIADDAAREEAMHDVRKAAKRLRYGVESASETLGKSAAQVAKLAKQITEILGDHNDSVITAALIGDLADEAFARGEDTFTYGRLQMIEESHASLSRDELTAVLASLNDNRFTGWKKI